MFLAFRICARPIFSEKGKDIFLFGVLPSKYSGRWRGFNSDSVLRKLFSGDMDFRKTETNLFFGFCPRGGGVWGGIRAGLYKTKICGMNTPEEILVGFLKIVHLQPKKEVSYENQTGLLRGHQFRTTCPN